MDDDYIAASEVASYLYCNRSWWLRHTRIAESSTPTLLMEQGIREHTSLAVEVRQIAGQRRFGWRLVLFALLLLMALIALKLATGI